MQRDGSIIGTNTEWNGLNISGGPPRGLMINEQRQSIHIFATLKIDIIDTVHWSGCLQWLWRLIMPLSTIALCKSVDCLSVCDRIYVIYCMLGVLESENMSKLFE